MITVLFFALCTLVLGIILLLVLRHHERSFGVLSGTHLYADTQAKPGVTLYARTIPLVGKPDYIVRKGQSIVPVEIKTGKTPATPFENHAMQLAAYCLLVHERYGKRPHMGYLVYPDRQFQVEYSAEAEAAVRSLVREILVNKHTNRELFCDHPEHNRTNLTGNHAI
jgi:CRISPR-associated exonuclease Cas4